MEENKNIDNHENIPDSEKEINRDSISENTDNSSDDQKAEKNNEDNAGTTDESSVSDPVLRSTEEPSASSVNNSVSPTKSKKKGLKIRKIILIAALAVVLLSAVFFACSYYLIFPDTGYALSASLKKNIGTDIDFKFKRFEQHGTMNADISISPEVLAMLNENLSADDNIDINSELMLNGNEFSLRNTVRSGEKENKFDISYIGGDIAVRNSELFGDTVYGFNAKNFRENAAHSVFSPTSTSKFAMSQDAFENLCNFFEDDAQNPYKDDFDTVYDFISDAAKASGLTKYSISYGTISSDGTDRYAKTKNYNISTDEVRAFVSEMIDIIKKEEAKISISEIAVSDTENKKPAQTTDTENVTETENNYLDWPYPEVVTTIVVQNPDLISSLNNILAVSGFEYENGKDAVQVNDYISLLGFLEHCLDELNNPENSVSLDISLSFCGKYLSVMTAEGNILINGDSSDFSFGIDFGTKPTKNNGFSAYLSIKQKTSSGEEKYSEVKLVYSLAENTRERFESIILLNLVSLDDGKEEKHDYNISCVHDRNSGDLKIVIDTDNGDEILSIDGSFKSSPSLLTFSLDSMERTVNGKVRKYDSLIDLTLKTECPELISPEYTDILPLKEKQIAELYKKINPILASAGFKVPNMTSDGYPLRTTDKELTELLDSYINAFKKYLVSETNAQKYVYVYDEEHNIYIVMAYSQQNNTIYYEVYNYINNLESKSSFARSYVGADGKLRIIG